MLFDKASVYWNEVLSNARCIEDKLNAYSVNIRSKIGAGLDSDAINVVLVALKDLGEEFNLDLLDSPLSPLASTELLSTRVLLESTGSAKFMSLAQMNVPKTLCAMKLMSDVINAMFRVNPHFMTLLCCRMIKLSISHGICQETCIGLLMYSVAQMNDADDVVHCYEWGKFAMSLLQRFGQGKVDLSERVKHFFLKFVRSWIEPMQSTAHALHSSYKDCQCSGDIETSASILAWYLVFSLFSGKNLTALESESANVALTVVRKEL